MFPFVQNLLKYAPLLHTRDVYEVLEEVEGNIRFHFCESYAGLFVLGYWLRYKELGPNVRKWIYAFGVFSIFGAAGFNLFFTQLRGKTLMVFSNNFSPFTIGICVALYIFCKYQLAEFSPGPVIRSTVAVSLQIYLVHVMVIEFLPRRIDVLAIPVSRWILIPLLTMVVFVISLVISIGIRYLSGRLKAWTTSG